MRLILISFIALFEVGVLCFSKSIDSHAKSSDLIAKDFLKEELDKIVEEFVEDTLNSANKQPFSYVFINKYSDNDKKKIENSKDYKSDIYGFDNSNNEIEDNSLARLFESKFDEEIKNIGKEPEISINKSPVNVENENLELSQKSLWEKIKNIFGKRKIDEHNIGVFRFPFKKRYIV
jgi:hypothetical protein